MRVLVASVLLLTGAVGGAAQPSRSPARIVAIADVHGAYAEYTALLKRVGIVDEQLKWSGGRTRLVQTGDYTDRGTDVRKVLDLLMRLEREAKSAGGQVIALNGNHEVMNFIGDWRDVTPEICATFATPKSEARREDAWKRYDRLKAERKEPPVPDVYLMTREQWMDAHAPGCLEYREAFSASGTYGRWLRQREVAAVVDGTLFMHAGITPARPAPRSIDEVNERARSEIRQLDSFRQRLVDRRLAVPSFTLQQILQVSFNELRRATQALEQAKAEGQAPPSLDLPFLREAQALIDIDKWSLVEPEGPLWFRGYALWDEATTAPQVTAFLDQMKLQRVAVGHTPTSDRKIHSRYGGRVVVMDTGMLQSVYKGAPSALEINGAALKAIYLDREEVLPTTAAGARR